MNPVPLLRFKQKAISTAFFQAKSLTEPPCGNPGLEGSSGNVMFTAQRSPLLLSSIFHSHFSPRRVEIKKSFREGQDCSRWKKETMLPMISLTLAGQLVGKKITRDETLCPFVFQKRITLPLGAPPPPSEGSWDQLGYYFGLYSSKSLQRSFEAA